MYNTAEFLELYKTLERWAESKFGDDGVKTLEQHHHDRATQQELRYFRNIRNTLSHNPNGSAKPLIELTDEFKVRFESLCNKLMGSITQIAIPYKDIYKREMSDKVLPTIAYMKEKSYSYVPIIYDKTVWGVFSESVIFDMVHSGAVNLINEDTTFLNITKYISAYSKDGVYDFVRSNASIDEIREIFSEAFLCGRRLDALYITSSGDQKGVLNGLVTIWDITNF